MLPIRVVIREFVTAKAESPDASDGELVRMLGSKGVDELVAERTVRFTPVAFGRFLLRGHGITFSNDFFRFDRLGNVTHTGRLSDDDVFVTATNAAPSFSNSPSFQSIALASPEALPIFQLLNEGSDSADLVAAPVAIFDEIPSAGGLEKAQQHLTLMLNPAPKLPTPPKTWWRFWSKSVSD